MTERLRSIDLFAGIGGIRLGFEQAFEDLIETVFVSEIDDHAKITYKSNFSEPLDVNGDITKIEERDLPEFDICLAGFPCQAFSIAGQKEGFKDNYKGKCRGTLFFDVIRICDHRRPKVIFLENVKGLVMHDGGRTLEIILNAIKEIGYTPHYKVLNSKDFGVPQNRERIYIVAFRNDIDSRAFEFPGPTDSTKTIKSIMEKSPVSVKYYLSTGYLETLVRHKERHIKRGNGFGYIVRKQSDIAGAIVCGGMGRERNLIFDNRQKNLTPITKIKGVVNTQGIRRMTPREWARLQGFPETFKLPLADVHLYKQLGNSVTVAVIKEIAKKIKEVLNMTKIHHGNKGEWSEVYAHLKLLSEGIMFGADGKMNIIESIRYDINKIFRDECYGPLEYVIEADCGNVSIKDKGGVTRIKVLMNEFGEEAKYLYKKMIETGSGLFESERTSKFMETIMFESLKAPSSNKSDIVMEVHDHTSGANPKLEFSIKSNIGGASTLLNASKRTNFIYEIEGDMTDFIMNEFNDMDSATKTLIRDKIGFLDSHHLEIKFDCMESKTFQNNLILIDSDLHKIVAAMLLEYYRGNGPMVNDLLNIIEKDNPLNYDNSGNHPFYAYKFKKLLTESALGMVPGSIWDGRVNVTGGYIVIREDGEAVCYHVYNRNEFEDYLVNNTFLDTPSTKRHGHGIIYKTDDGKYVLKLCLQIRFVKPSISKKTVSKRKSAKRTCGKKISEYQ